MFARACRHAPCLSNDGTFIVTVMTKLNHRLQLGFAKSARIHETKRSAALCITELVSLSFIVKLLDDKIQVCYSKIAYGRQGSFFLTLI